MITQNIQKQSCVRGLSREIWLNFGPSAIGRVFLPNRVKSTILIHCCLADCSTHKPSTLKLKLQPLHHTQSETPKKSPKRQAKASKICYPDP